MLRIVPHNVPRVGRSYEHFPDGFELHLLQPPRETETLGEEEFIAKQLIERESLLSTRPA